MAFKLLNAEYNYTRTGVTFFIPHFMQDAWQGFIGDLWAKGIKQLKVSIERPYKPRTVGEKSQNHAIHGKAVQLAMITGHDKADILDIAKERALKRGYPTRERFDGHIVPQSETKLSTIEAGYLIDELDQIAAELGEVLL